MVNSSYTKILYGAGEGQNHKKLAEITNTARKLCLYLQLPTTVETAVHQLQPLQLFGFAPQLVGYMQCPCSPLLLLLSFFGVSILELTIILVKFGDKRFTSSVLGNKQFSGLIELNLDLIKKRFTSST